MKLNDIPTPVWWLAVGSVAAFAVYQLAKRGAAAIGAAVDPTSSKNIAYQGVSQVGAALTGDASWSPGTALYNFFHPNEGQDIVAPSPATAKPTHPANVNVTRNPPP